MLIRMAILERIKSGEVTLAFRRWRRPTVKTGGSLKTAVGVIEIHSVEKTNERKISETDTRQAGYSSKDALLNDLGRREGQLYKIALAYAGEDPRIALRADEKLNDEEFRNISEQLRRWDSASRVGPWTRGGLMSIKNHPKLPAAQLAIKTGFEKAWLKNNVRKLKELGLTVSQPTGYSLSPRGVAVVERLKNEK